MNFIAGVIEVDRSLKATKFSLVVFAPLFFALLLPAMFLLPNGLLMTLLIIFDPTISFSEAIPYNIWIIAPFAAGSVLFLVGIFLHSFYSYERSSRLVWTVIWLVFTSVLFLAIWFGFTLMTSIGASDKPIEEFLRWTACFAAGFTLLAQVLELPWLFVVSRILHKDEIQETTTITLPGCAWFDQT